MYYVLFLLRMLFNVPGLFILAGFYLDFRRNKSHVFILLRFIFITFPVTAVITALLFYPLAHYTFLWFMFPAAAYPFLLLAYKKIYEKYLMRKKSNRTNSVWL